MCDTLVAGKPEIRLFFLSFPESAVIRRCGKNEGRSAVTIESSVLVTKLPQQEVETAVSP